MITYLNIPSNTPFLKIGGKTYLIDKEDYEKYAGWKDYFEIIPVKEFIDKKGNRITVIRIQPHKHSFVYEQTLYSHKGTCSECGEIESWVEHNYELVEENINGVIKISSVCKICSYKVSGGVEYHSIYKYLKNKINLDELDTTSPEHFIGQLPKILENLSNIIDAFVVEKEWQRVYYVCSFCQEQRTEKDELKKHIYEHLREEWERKAPDPDWREWIAKLESAFRFGNIKDRDLTLYVCPLCGAELEDARDMPSHLRNEIRSRIKTNLAEIIGQDKILDIVWEFVVKNGKNEHVEKMSYDEIVAEIARLEANRYIESEEYIIEEIREDGRHDDYDPLYDDVEFYQRGFETSHQIDWRYQWRIAGKRKVKRDILAGNWYYYALIYYKTLRDLDEEKRKLFEGVVGEYKQIDERVNELLKNVTSVVKTPREVQIKRRIEGLQGTEKEEFERYKKEYETLWDKAGEILEKVEIKVEKGVSKDLTGKSVMLEVLQKIEWQLDSITKDLNNLYIPGKIYEFLKVKGLIEREEAKIDPWVHYEWHTVYVKGGVVCNVDDLSEKILEKLNLKDEYLKYIEPLRKKNEELLKQVDLLRKQIGEIKNKIKSIK